MTALEWITTALLVLAMGGIGGMKLARTKDAIEQSERLGYDKILIPIGVAEVATGFGVVLGAAITDLEWLGMAAAAVIIVMMIGAAGFHIRARDKFETIPSIVVGVAAALYLVALNAS